MDSPRTATLWPRRTEAAEDEVRELRWATGVIACGLLACRDEPAPAPPPEVSAHVVEFRARLADGRYVFDAEAPPMVRADAPGDWSLSWSGAPLNVEAEPHGEHVFLRVRATEVSPGEGLLELTRPDGVKHRWAARWGAPPESLPELAEVQRFMAAKDWSAALALLERELPRWAESAPEVHLWAVVEKARAFQRSGRLDEAVEAWKSAAEVAEKARVPSEVSRRLRAAAYVSWLTRRHHGVLALLDEADAIDRGIDNPVGLLRAARHRNAALLQLGRHRDAEAALRSSMRLAEAWSQGVSLQWARQYLAPMLADQGRYSEALAALEAVRPVDPGQAAMLQLNRAWIRLNGALSGALERSALTTAREELQRSLVYFQDAGQRADAANAHANLAAVSMELGELDTARHHLRRADASGFHALFAALQRGELHLREGAVDAAGDAFEAALATARAEVRGGTGDQAWRGLFGLARVHRARGETGKALARLAEATAEIDGVARNAALLDARAPYYADRAEPVRRYVAMLLDAGRVRDAWRSADAARARVLKALEARGQTAGLTPALREAWERRRLDWLARRDAFESRRREGALLDGEAKARWRASRDAERAGLERQLDALYAWLDQQAPPAVTTRSRVPELAADEALIACFALDEERRVAFRRVGAGPIEHAVGEVPALLEWIAEIPNEVAHLYLVSGDQPPGLRAALPERVSLSALPYAGWLDAEEAPAAGRPLVVGDPDGTLPQALREARTVADRLDARRLLGRAATRAAVLEAARDARLFHFAGHGVLRPENPWEAHLKLAGAQRLSLTDVLAARARPALVVLSGCETGVASPLSADEAVGLPEAFLAAGAARVLGTNAKVEDAAAREVIEAFYAANGIEQPAEALRSIQRGESDPKLAEAARAFRLVGRR